MLSADQLEQVRATLFSGQYNLLLGSGVSLDSSDRSGANLPSATDLAAALCSLTGAKPNTALSRVATLLDPKQTREHLTDRYSNCRPGPTVRNVTNFLWKTAFTFNIDDALEAAYEALRVRKQDIDVLNFDSVYETAPNRSRLPVVHLHGFSRESDKGYVFSVAEYGRVTRGLNPWMHVLSELLASEPFIISGTSLNEPDLEYYLSGRSENTPRKNRGPSILVEPYPDAVTESDCRRHNLILVKATLNDFLSWLISQLGQPPTVSQLVVPPIEKIFLRAPPPIDQVSFFSAFQLVRPVLPNPSGTLSPFLYGKAPTWSDLESSLDIPTEQEQRSSARIRSFLEAPDKARVLSCLLADPGAGKTTNLRRIAYDLSKEGRIVFVLTSKVSLDIEVVVSCLSQVCSPFALVLDGIANHAPFVRALLTNKKISKPFAVLGADRLYRKDHIDRVLGDLEIEFDTVENWPLGPVLQLIEKYRQTGLVGVSDAIRYPEKFGRDLLGDVVAVNTCRILNSFRPLDSIIKSLWNDASESARRSYVIAALAEHCYSGGVLYPILEAAHRNGGLQDQLSLECSLPLAYSGDDDSYVLPLHPVIGERALLLLSREKKDTALEVFVKLAEALAPYVNRKTVIEQTPEARLAGRLFNAESVVRPLLGDRSEAFYAKVQERWKWNSRYWEQRALLVQHSDIDTAVQYARHAVAIEEHPFPWTTLASILVRKLEMAPEQREALFSEVMELLIKVFGFEERRAWRPTPHPYATLFHAVDAFLSCGGALAGRRKEWVSERIEKCNSLFVRDVHLMAKVTKVKQGLGIV